MNHYDQADFVSGNFEWKIIEEKTADRGEDKEIIARHESPKNIEYTHLQYIDFSIYHQYL